MGRFRVRMGCICSNNYEIEAATPKEAVEETESKMNNEVLASNYVADWENFSPLAIEVYNEELECFEDIDGKEFD